MLPEKRIVLQGHTLGTAPQDPLLEGVASETRVFLLSPANSSGARAKQLFSPRAHFDLAQRLRTIGAPLGEVFSFISGLYFRGKLAYAEKFASAVAEIPPIQIITPAAGLVSPSTTVTIEQLREMTTGPVDPASPGYREPLDRDARKLLNLLGQQGQIVLLGSIATAKYSDPLLQVFGSRLVFPEEFVGRGDMSRGSLLLRASRAAVPLAYVSLLDFQARANPQQREKVSK